MISNKKRIIYFVNADWYFLLHWKDRALEAKKRGYDVVVVTNVDKKRSEIESLGLKVISISIWRSWVSIIREIHTITSLFIIIKKYRPSIIHSVTIKPNIFGLLIAWYYSIPIVCNISGLGILYTKSKKIYAVLRLLTEVGYKILSHITNSHLIFENNSDLNMFRTKTVVKKNNSSSIPGAGVDENLFQFTHEPQNAIITVLFASRMLRSKGVNTIIEASKILIENNVNSQIIFAGILDYDSPDSVNESILQEWASDGLIMWLGEVSNMPDLINRSNIVIMPTAYQEGIPRIIIEALACGRPVITTDVAGCNEIIDDGINGLIIPVNNPMALVEAIIKLVDQPELRRNMGINGRKLFLRKYSNKIVFNYTFHIYSKLLSDGS